MSKVYSYTTKGGERWDNIAHIAWGDAFVFGDVLAANRNLPRYDVFPQGIKVNIPIKNRTDGAPLNLPPWKTP